MEQTAAGVQSGKQEALKVLIADDDAPTRMLLRAAISQWGYSVMEVKDGEEAWEIMQKDKDNPPRILILDWLMPKMDGVTLAERIKHELSEHPYIYIILLTQKSGTINIIKSLEAGADAFLSKPFDMTELRSRLTAGARMVKYDNQIIEKNKQLQTYVASIEKMELAINKFKQMLAGLEKDQTDEHLKKINVLTKEVDTLLETVTNLKHSPGKMIDE